MRVGVWSTVVAALSSSTAARPMRPEADMAPSLGGGASPLASFTGDRAHALAEPARWTSSSFFTPFLGLMKKPNKGVERDWDKYPAILNVPAAPDEIWALGDVHGDVRRAERLLTANKLMRCQPDAQPGPCSPHAAQWTGGSATLVQTGDIIDKGAGSVSMIHLLQRLEQMAPLQGGAVYPLLGNHEASFLAKPLNAKTLGPGGLVFELWHRNLDPVKYATDHYADGAWLRRRPFGACIGHFFFAHAGQTSSRTRDGLDDYLRHGVARDGFDTPALSGENSILRARDFAGRDGVQGPDLAQLLGVKHIVFGHDPEVSPRAGKVYAFGKYNDTFSLFAIDTGMTRLIDYGEGELWHAKRERDHYLIEACDHRGKCEELTRAPVA